MKTRGICKDCYNKNRSKSGLLLNEYKEQIIDKEKFIGQKFGKLTVVSFNGIMERRSFWNCLCDCGNYTTVPRNSLKRHLTTSCGCARRSHLNYYKLSSDGEYYNVFILRYVDQNLNFDLHIFENSDIYIEPLATAPAVSATTTYIESLISFKKPDFIIDGQFYSELNKFSWTKGKNKLITTDIKRKKVTLQKFIINLITPIGKKQAMQKIKNNDYRLTNLVFLNCSSKMHYLHNKVQPKGSDGYRGVYKTSESEDAGYFTYISFKNKRYRFGSFATSEEAAEVYNIKALEFFGKHAYQNKIQKLNKKINSKKSSK